MKNLCCANGTIGGGTTGRYNPSKHSQRCTPAFVAWSHLSYRGAHCDAQWRPCRENHLAVCVVSRITSVCASHCVITWVFALRRGSRRLSVTSCNHAGRPPPSPPPREGGPTGAPASPGVDSRQRWRAVSRPPSKPHRGHHHLGQVALTRLVRRSRDTRANSSLPPRRRPSAPAATTPESATGERWRVDGHVRGDSLGELLQAAGCSLERDEAEGSG